MAILTLLKQTGLQVTKDLTGLLLIKAVTGLQLIHQWTGLLLLILLVQRIITAHNTHRFSNSFSTNRFTRIQRHFIKLFRTLKNDKSVTIYHRNLQTLVHEAFKIKKNMAPKILTDIFSHKEYNYNVKNSTGLQGRTIETVTYASEIISSLEPKI